MEKLFPLEQMGETAENLVDEMKISRADQDQFALRSHQRAVASRKDFEREIVPVEIATKKGTDVVKVDEGPREDSSLDALAKLKPAFRANGSVTAGNSSTLNDGSAAVVVTSRAFAKAHGLNIRAVIRSMASAGVNPRTMGIGPVPATRKALERADMTLNDIEAIELNEAFAAQSLACTRQLGLADDVVEARVNLRGGAIALGHPLGATGAVRVATLLHGLRRRRQKYGMVTMCIGTGMGAAGIFEAL
jgi:acetyl-CoA acetyltransferase family protein